MVPGGPEVGRLWFGNMERQEDEVMAERASGTTIYWRGAGIRAETKSNIQLLEFCHSWSQAPANVSSGPGGWWGGGWGGGWNAPASSDPQIP